MLFVLFLWVVVGVVGVMADDGGEAERKRKQEEAKEKDKELAKKRMKVLRDAKARLLKRLERELLDVNKRYVGITWKGALENVPGGPIELLQVRT